MGMMIFNEIRRYAGKWQIKSSRLFSQEEKDAVKSATVVASSYGNSVCFTMVSGGMTFIPLSSGSSLGVGESVDMNKAKLLTLEREGEVDINRVEI